MYLSEARYCKFIVPEPLRETLMKCVMHKFSAQSVRNRLPLTHENTRGDPSDLVVSYYRNLLSHHTWLCGVLGNLISFCLLLVVHPKDYERTCTELDRPSLCEQTGTKGPFGLFSLTRYPLFETPVSKLILINL